MLCRINLIAISLFALSAQAQAQMVATDAAGRTPGYYGYSSTLQEGVQHGYADVLRAEGCRAYDMSRAASQFEDAREKSLENHQQAVQQYYALRELNQAYRNTKSTKPAPKSSSVVKVSHPAVPSSAAILSNGRIDWPAALEGLDAGDARKQLEKLVNLRASNRGKRLATKQYQQGCEAITQIEVDLKASIGTLSAADYMAAKKMLQSLKHELAQPAQEDLLSQN
jgi:hypothetical protein